ncbi:tetratricopeptide repeat protein [Aestuariibius insulae]|uniref:tetratricopeptide repeat protein n=1 Tax=Aestuariibius insulae TaxID=2058287 RepID=UPI00398ECE34
MRPISNVVLKTLSVMAILLLAACEQENFAPTGDRVFAPGLAGEADVDGLTIGHRLMAAGQYELALKSYQRAAATQGLTADTLSAIASANLELGRLNQAERLMRQAVSMDPTFAAAWNNLGVILMERGNVTEARQVFRRAFATDNGQSEEIRDNLKLAIAKSEDPGYNPTTDNNTKLVRRGTGDYLILQTP